MSEPAPHTFALFRSLDAEELRLLTSRAREVRLSTGDVLFRQGGRGDSLFLLVDGQIEVTVGDAADAEHRLAALGPGSILGEVAVLVDAPRTATAIALTDARLWEISRASFEEALAAGRAWGAALLGAIASALAERLAAVDRRLSRLIDAERETAGSDGGTRVAELERLRRRLLSDWTF